MLNQPVKTTIATASQQPITVAALTTNATAPVTNSKTSHPPPSVPDGGIWGTLKYVGQTTKILACCGFLIFCLPGLCVLACPQDEKDAYKVNGNYYDAAGGIIQGVNPNNFVPSKSGPS